MPNTATAPSVLMISAGEASGDVHAAHALHSFTGLHGPIDCFGMGAGQLAGAGMELIVDCRDLAVIGIVDVLINYPRFRRRLALLRETMRARRPALLLLVDYPDFNLKLAETAGELGIPVLFYVSPQVWAWRSGRVPRIGRLIDHMAVLFPFEVAVYEAAGIPVTYVGNPLVDDAVSTFTQTEARQHFDLRMDAPLVALLPGSRGSELDRHLPGLLAAAARVLQHHPDCQFLLPRAPSLDVDRLERHLAAASVSVTLVEGQACDALRAADAAWVASGTATLEAAMIGTPMAIIYRLHWLNHAIMKRLIRIDDIGLVNIVAGQRVVEEFIQDRATPEALADEMLRLLDDAPYADAQRKALQEVRERLGDGGASTRVAGLMTDLLSVPPRVHSHE